MPTNIKQTRDDKRSATVLKVEGEMLFNDAVLLEKIARSVRQDTGDSVILDLADLDLLDSEAASVLRRIANAEGFQIVGTEIFLQTIVDRAERHKP
ncbi:MAG: STAS domain-containing protein [Pyrinomonadaceae bacterium]